MNSDILMPEKVFERLHALCTVRKVKNSAVVFTQGEAPRGITLLQSGDIALTPDAMEPSLCRIASPPSILGLPANLSNQPYSLTAVAVGTCEFAVLPRKVFMETIQRDPEIALGILQMLAKELEHMQNQSVQIRLAHMH